MDWGRVVALWALVLLAACAEDQSYLDRWDDPRVIQIEPQQWRCPCIVIPERPSHIDWASKKSPSLEGIFYRGFFQRAGCHWYDAFIWARKAPVAFALHIASGDRIFDLYYDFSTKVMPPPPPPGATPPFPPAPRIPPRIESFRSSMSWWKASLCHSDLSTGRRSLRANVPLAAAITGADGGLSLRHPQRFQKRGRHLPLR